MGDPLVACLLGYLLGIFENKQPHSEGILSKIDNETMNIPTGWSVHNYTSMHFIGGSRVHKKLLSFVHTH